MYSVFACGADIKNKFSLFQEGNFYFSDNFGNLENPENFNRYLSSVKKMAAKYAFSPDIIAFDLHPGYFSSKARDIFPKKVKRIAVQHHHAHLAGILGKLNIKETVIGISFDGTGYGLDGHLWGGEFFTVSVSELKRKAHFKYLKMPGGEQAVYEPWRLAFSLLFDYLGDKLLKKDFEFLQIRPKQDYLFLKKMIEKNINLPLTSSCGRLFDAISSCLGITQVIKFEAEAAINLEKTALLSDDKQWYSFDIEDIRGTSEIGYKSLLENMLHDLKQKKPKEIIAKRFHNSLARLILKIAQLLQKKEGLNKIVLSGGVFQNKLLYTMANTLLKEAGFTVLEDNTLPLNDLGISTGQTYVALHKANTL